MKNNISRSLYIGVFLLILLMPSEFSAATLRTKSGKIYRGYQISRVQWNQVEIVHSDGVVWLKHEELPQAILERYSEEIERKKQQRLRRIASVIRKKISQAKEETDSSAMIEKLKKIKEQFPHHPLIAEVDKLIEGKKLADSVEKSLRSIISKGAIGKQIAQLQQLLKKTSDPGQIKKINLLLTEKKDLQKNHAAVIDNSISLAAAQEIPEDAIRELKNILAKYPEHPFPGQQKNYLAKIDQLISEKQKEHDNAKQKKTDRHSAYIRKNPDAETLLKNMFLRELEYDRKLSKKILTDSIKLAEGINNARTQSPETAISTLDQYLKSYKFAVNKADAQQLKSQLVDRINAERERAKQQAAIKNIRATAHGNGPFIIRKRINPGSRWLLELLPLSAKNDVSKIEDFRQECYRERTKSGSYEKQAELARMNLETDESIRLTLAAVSSNNASYGAAKNAVSLLKKILPQAEEFSIRGNVCSLSNITTPVLLMALEYDVKPVFNMWYMVYIPGESKNTWILE